MDSVPSGLAGLTGDLGGLLLANWIWFALGLAAIVGLILYQTHKVAVDFWRMNAWYGIPVFGKLARLSRDKSMRMRDGWLHSEDTLCTDYGKFIRFLPPAEFEQRQLYLKKAQDLGRVPLPFWLLSLLILLVVAEGYGFSYLLAGSLASDMSENARQIGTLAIVIVLCILLVFITHQAGHHLHRNLLLRRCRVEWDEDQRPGPLRTGTISLTDEQRSDDKSPEYTQCMNRLEPHQNWWIIVVAVIFIVLMATLQVGMRFWAAEEARIQDTAGVAAASTMPNFDAQPLPDGLAAPQAAADAKATADARSASQSMNLVGFVMLSVIFVVTQAMGTYSGYKYGFAGKQSSDAYRETRGAPDYHEYISRVDGWISLAEARLATLHHRIQLNQVNHSLTLDKTFKDFIRERLTHDWYDVAAPRRTASRAGATTSPQPAGAGAPPANQTSVKSAAIAEALDRASAMEKAERDEFLAGLDDDEVYTAVVAELRGREERRRKRKAELDGLA